MKYGDFFSQTKDLFNNLQIQLDEYQNDYLLKQDEFAKKLIDDKIVSKTKVELLESKYQQNDENNNQNISTIKSIIQHLQSELEKVISEYNASHNSVQDKELILSIKEEKLSDFKQAKKKAIFDLNQRINTIDRECILSLKAKLIEFEEEKNLFKNKLNDIEKKMRYEVSKIENEILSPEIKTSSELENNHNYQNTKEVIDFRKDGINQIAKLKKKYNKDIRDLEIKFAKYEAEYNRDNRILREEYNLQIEALKYEKLRLQREMDIANVEYDFGAYKQANINEKTYKDEKANFKKAYYEKIKDNYNKINTIDNNYNKVSYDQTVDLLNNITVEDNMRLDDIYKHLVDTNNNFYNRTKDLNELLNTIVSNYLLVFENLLVTHWNNIYSLEKTLYESLLIADYHSYSFNEFNYNSYRDKIKSLYKQFKSDQKDRLNDFNKQLKISIERILNEILVISKNYSNYINEEVNSFNKYLSLFKNINGLSLKDGILSANNNYLSKEDRIKQNFANVNNNLNNLNNEIINDFAFSNEEFNLNCKELEDKIKKYQLKNENIQKNDMADYNSIVNNINNNIKDAKNEFSNILKKKKKEANNKFNNEVKNITKDQKTRLRMGQI